MAAATSSGVNKGVVEAGRLWELLEQSSCLAESSHRAKGRWKTSVDLVLHE